MKISRRGKDLAVRIPASVVKQLDLKQGDEISIEVLGSRQLAIRRTQSKIDESVPDFFFSTSNSDAIAKPKDK